MEEADYPGVRVSMETKFDGVITPLKIDISTGDMAYNYEINLYIIWKYVKMKEIKFKGE